MEIESKYTTSREQYEKLLKTYALGQYSLKDIEEQNLTDHYMDTDEYDIKKSGHACRIRIKNRRWTLTLKGLGGVDGIIHQREEHETEIEPYTSPEQWPDGSTENLVRALINSRPLEELCIIHQKRIKRAVYHNQRHVGEMSLDVVEMGKEDISSIIYEIEIELQNDGTLEDLKTLDTILQTYDLIPEPRSKFERAMEQIS